LSSGNHAAVARWRREQALRRTFERRPELLEHIDLPSQDDEFLGQLADDAQSEAG
jgi:tRNA (guanine37-N1)-methyltransferase